FVIRRQVKATINRRTVARFETYDWWIDPFVSEELGIWRGGYFPGGVICACGERLIRKHIKLRRFVAVRTHVRDHRFIGRDIDLVLSRQSRDLRARAAADRHRIKMP